MPEFDPAAFAPQILREVQERFGGPAPALVDSGTHYNLVYTQPNAPQPYTIKISNLESPADAQAAVTHEAVALEAINNATEPCPFVVPKVLAQQLSAEGGAWPHLVLSYVPGEVGRQDASDLGVKIASDIGFQIAKFSIWAAQAVNANAFAGVPAPPHAKDWDTFLNFEFEDRNLPNFSLLAAGMRQQRQRLYPNGIAAAADRFIHGDLRLPNIAFVNYGRHKVMEGIIDFGNAAPGDLLQEMRCLPLMSDGVLKGCNAALSAHGMKEITPQEAQFWLMGRAVSGLIRTFAADCRSPWVERAVNRLGQWYPFLDWQQELRPILDLPVGDGPRS